MTLEQCLEDKWRGQSGAVVEEFKEMIKDTKEIQNTGILKACKGKELRH